jgi:hypothetical protein
MDQEVIEHKIESLPSLAPMRRRKMSFADAA